ncbi:MAG: hypothetical protein ACP5NI_06610 [Acetobacteraceae bacterium]
MSQAKDPPGLFAKLHDQALVRVIIGGGVAAEVFRQTADPAVTTWIFGNGGLWANVAGPHTDGGHKIGQPAHVLSLPGQKVPAYQKAMGSNPTDYQGFLDSGEFQKGVKALSLESQRRDEALEVPGAKVTRIRRHGNGRDLLVTYEAGGKSAEIFANQVVIATGIGPQMGPGIAAMPAGGEIAEYQKARGFPPIMEGLQYLAMAQGDRPQRRRGHVRNIAVYGGGGTSGWLVDQALHSSAPRRFLWVVRPGGSGYSKAMLPGSRNQMTLEKTLAVRQELEILSLTIVPANAKPMMDELDEKTKAPIPMRNRPRPYPRLRLKVKGELTGGQPGYMMIDLFLYSIGPDPTAQGSIMSILEPALYQALQPLKDYNMVLSGQARGRDDILALEALEGNLLVIGAASFAGVRLYDPQTQGAKTRAESAPMETLPWGSQVPDGIAVAVATISALNNFVPIKQVWNGKCPFVVESNINFNLADANQLACYISAFTDMKAGQVENCVQEILRERSRRGTAPNPNDPHPEQKGKTYLDVMKTGIKDPANLRSERGKLEEAYVADPQHEKAFGLTGREVLEIIQKYDPTYNAL